MLKAKIICIAWYDLNETENNASPLEQTFFCVLGGSFNVLVCLFTYLFTALEPSGETAGLVLLGNRSSWYPKKHWKVVIWVVPVGNQIVLDVATIWAKKTSYFFAGPVNLSIHLWVKLTFTPCFSIKLLTLNMDCVLSLITHNVFGNAKVSKNVKDEVSFFGML